MHLLEHLGDHEKNVEQVLLEVAKGSNTCIYDLVCLVYLVDEESYRLRACLYGSRAGQPCETLTTCTGNNHSNTSTLTLFHDGNPFSGAPN